MKLINKYINDSILDYFDLNVLDQIILEKNGVYEGCEELTDFILKDIEKKYNNNEKKFVLTYIKNKLTKFKNIFFEKLTLSINFINNDEDGVEFFGAYDGNDKLNEKTLLFDEVEIKFNLISLSEFNHVFIHEINHAFVDYKKILKTGKGIKEIGNSSFYKNIVSWDYDDQENLDIKQILYYTFKDEVNAFTTAFSAALKENKNKIKTPKDALTIIKRTEEYRTYKHLYCIIERYFHYYEKQNSTDLEEWRRNGFKDRVNKITKYYNEISNTNMSTEKVFKKLKFLIDKTNKKIDSIIGKLCVEYIQ